MIRKLQHVFALVEGRPGFREGRGMVLPVQCRPDAAGGRGDGHPPVPAGDIGDRRRSGGEGFGLHRRGGGSAGAAVPAPLVPVCVADRWPGTATHTGTSGAGTAAPALPPPRRCRPKPSPPDRRRRLQQVLEGGHHHAHRQHQLTGSTMPRPSRNPGRLSHSGRTPSCSFYHTATSFPTFQAAAWR